MTGRQRGTAEEAETVEERIETLRRTTERIAVVVQGARERIQHISDDVDELLYRNADEATAVEDNANAGAAKGKGRPRPRTSCHGCPTPGERAVERIVTEGCRQGVAYCTRCAAEAKTVLERHATPYETARIGA